MVLHIRGLAQRSWWIDLIRVVRILPRILARVNPGFGMPGQTCPRRGVTRQLGRLLASRAQP